jgi:hypothetical protein
MTLVQQLRIIADCDAPYESSVLEEAADRIEELETALRKLAYPKDWDEIMQGHVIAQVALNGGFGEPTSRNPQDRPSDRDG